MRPVPLINKKKCRTCGRTKPLDAFYKASGSEHLHRAHCKVCWIEKFSRRTPEQHRRANYRRYHKNLAKSRAISRANVKRYREELRERAISVLGGGCLCGISDPRALQIDHPREDGHVEKLFGLSGAALYRAVLTAPQLYALLCANCNWRKWRATCRRQTRSSVHSGTHKDRLRAEMISHLGSRCAHCPCDDPVVLQIDHVQGGGGRERKDPRKKSVSFLHRDVLRTTGKYQLLCANCNRIKVHENQEARGVRKTED